MADSPRSTLDELARLGLLTEEVAAEYKPRLRQEFTTTQALLEALVRAKSLTKFQASVALRGKAQGLVLGHYVLLDKLGAGGMGQVFRARHKLMGRLVAVKVLSRERTESARAVQRFQREIQAAARLSHPNIVAAHDAESHGGMHYLVMELVEGEDLYHLVRRGGPLAAHLALDYTVQAARGLAYAHEQGIVHRDVKPANLLLGADGVVKVMDLGLARYQQEAAAEKASGLTEPGALMGTVDFMAPEQAMAPQDADPRSDQYSLGATLFFLLTGEPMFSGDSLMSRLVAHRTERIPSLAARRPDTPPALIAVFEKMVAKRPADRFGSLAEAIQALEAARPACAAGVTPAQSPAARTVAVGPPPGSEYRLAHGSSADGEPCEAPPIIVPRSSDRPSRQRTQLFASGTTFVELLRRHEPAQRCVTWLGKRPVVAAIAGIGSCVLLATAVALPWLTGKSDSGNPQQNQVADTLPVDIRPPEAPAPSGNPEPIAPPKPEIATAPPNELLFPVLAPAVPPLDAPAPPGPPAIAAETSSAAGSGATGSLPVGVSPDPPPPSVDWLGPARQLAGLSDKVLAAGFSPNDQIVVAGGSEGKIGLWNVADGAPIRLIDFPHGAVQAVAFNRNATVLACGGAEGAVFYNAADWEATDVAAWQQLRTNGQARGVLNIIPCNVSCFRLAGGIDRFYHFNPDGTLSGNYGLSPPMLAGPALAVRLDQLRFAGSSGEQIVVYQSELLADGKRQFKTMQTLAGHSAPVACLAYSPSQEYLASGASDRTVRLWKADDGASIATRELDGQVIAIAFSPDNALLLAATDTGRVVGLAIPKLEVMCSYHLPAGEAIHAFALAADGKHLATTGDGGRVLLWDVALPAAAR